MGFNEAVSYEQLRVAMMDCSRNVKWKGSVCEFLLNAPFRLTKLQQELIDDTYTISRYQKFTITEPKKREIVSTRLRDRIWQRSMCNNGLYDDLTRSLIYDNCACLVGRGISFAFKRIKTHMQQHFRQYGNTGYVLKIDISKFFASIPHIGAKLTVAKRVRDVKFLKHVYAIIDSFEDPRDRPEILKDKYFERGLGLGSQISQLIALAYLDDVDHLMKEVYRVRHYIRYMDDIVIIVPTKEQANSILRIMKHELDKLGLIVNKKTNISEFCNGIRFLKRRYFVTSTGRVIALYNRKSLSRERRKLKKLISLVDQNKIEMDAIFEHYTCWKNYAMQTSSRACILKMDHFLNNLLQQRGYKIKCK